MVAFPFPGVRHQFLTYRDAKGNTARVSFYLDDNGGDNNSDATLVESIITAINNISNAAYQSASGAVSHFGVAQYGAAGVEYQPIQTKAQLVYQDVSGGLHRLQIPSPKSSIFLADLQTVNPAAAGIVTLNGLMAAATVPATGTAFVCSRSGLLISNFMGGVLKTTKLRRKLNILVLTPLLTGGEPAE